MENCVGTGPTISPKLREGLRSRRVFGNTPLLGWASVRCAKFTFHLTVFYLRRREVLRGMWIFASKGVDILLGDMYNADQESQGLARWPLTALSAEPGRSIDWISGAPLASAQVAYRA